MCHSFPFFPRKSGFADRPKCNSTLRKGPGSSRGVYIVYLCPGGTRLRPSSLSRPSLRLFRTTMDGSFGTCLHYSRSKTVRAMSRVCRRSCDFVNPVDA